MSTTTLVEIIILLKILKKGNTSLLHKVISNEKLKIAGKISNIKSWVDFRIKSKKKLNRPTDSYKLMFEKYSIVVVSIITYSFRFFYK